MNKKIIIVALILYITMVALMLSISAKSQFITSFGTGYEIKNRAIPVQLTAGVNIGRSEVVAGYTAFFHKNDATIPKILFVRYGFNLTGNDGLQILPLIGAVMLTKTTYDQGTYGEDIVTTPKSFEILYGLKVQKNMGAGGLFVSVERCKLTNLIFGMYIKIN